MNLSGKEEPRELPFINQEDYVVLSSKYLILSKQLRSKVSGIMSNRTFVIILDLNDTLPVCTNQH